MANLDLIKRLNENYGKNSSIIRETRLFSINEALDPNNIEKAITDSIADLGPLFTMYFDFGLPADVVLLFIDVCGFSTKYSNLDGEEIGEYFDEYYDVIIPIIYKYGGEIDKIMGDGIICIFGPPFQDLTLKENIIKADQCSREIIKVTKGTKFASKIALHSGSINYFKNKTGLYKEFTIIGKPLTELFRLESISNDDQINYYHSTDVYSFYQEIMAKSSNSSQPAAWISTNYPITNLKGVDFKYFSSIKYNR